MQVKRFNPASAFYKAKMERKAMKYELKITALAENPDYEKQMKEYDNDRYGKPIPDRIITVSCLETVVNEEQFSAIRKAALEVF